MSMPLSPTTGLQESLAAEHAAMYLFGFLGARCSESQDPDLFAELSTSFVQHRHSRDKLQQLIAKHGAEPLPSAIAYEPPGPVTTAAELRRTALVVEKRVTLAYGQLVENTSGADRTYAIGSLSASALRELAYGAAPQVLPGS